MARQFARPRGLFGRLFLGGMLDRANVRTNALVFDVMAVAASDHVLEVGFGGGDLLLRLAGAVTGGRVEGVELSDPCSGGSAPGFAGVAWPTGCDCTPAPWRRCPSMRDGSTARAASTRSTSGRTFIAGWWSSRGCCAPEDAWCSVSARTRRLRRAGYEERGFSLYTAAQIEDALRANGFAPSALERLDREGPRGAFFVSRSERMGTGEQ